MKKKQVAENPDRHKKKEQVKQGLTFAERKRLAELKHRLAGTNKNEKKPITAQQTITFQKMYRDGICQVTPEFYTKMVEFYDINYDLLEIEDKGEILEEYSRLINYFDPSIKANTTTTGTKSGIRMAQGMTAKRTVPAFTSAYA